MTACDPLRPLPDLGYPNRASENMTTRMFAIIGFLCVAVFVVNAQSSDIESSDEQQIRKLIAEHAAASQIGDFDALVSGYRADSDVRYADGVLLDGKQAIEQSYREILRHGPTTMAHTHPEESTRIRFIRDDVAFADIISLSGGGTDEHGAVSTPRRVAVFVVFTKVGGEWGVAVERIGAPVP